MGIVPDEAPWGQRKCVCRSWENTRAVGYGFGDEENLGLWQMHLY